MPGRGLTQRVKQVTIWGRVKWQWQSPRCCLFQYTVEYIAKLIHNKLLLSTSYCVDRSVQTLCSHMMSSSYAGPEHVDYICRSDISVAPRRRWPAARSGSSASVTLARAAGGHVVSPRRVRLRRRRFGDGVLPYNLDTRTKTSEHPYKHARSWLGASS